MTAWLASPYRVAGTYLGGAYWACDYGNFNRSWVNQVAAEGWRFLPLGVGPQASCSTIPGATPGSTRAGLERRTGPGGERRGRRGLFGYGTGTPIYFDMEGYDSSIPGCSRAVMNFLARWTEGLHLRATVSGVYSSAASGIADLASQAGNRAFEHPDDIGIADWNGKPVLSDPFVPDRDWAGHQRVHQYYGPVTESWGGASVNLDRDVIDGEVAGPARLPGQPPSSVPGPPGVQRCTRHGHQVRLAIGGTATATLARLPGPLAGARAVRPERVPRSRPGGPGSRTRRRRSRSP